MSFSKVYSAQINLLSAEIIIIEVDISQGLYNFSVVGLPDKAVEESRDRVNAAIKNSGFKSPKAINHKIIVSLAPAQIKKEGPVFDLGIALAYLLAFGDIKFNPEKKIFLGELSLDGDLRRIDGVLKLVEESKKRGFEEIYVPIENAIEAALIDGIKVYGVKNLKELLVHLDGRKKDQEKDSGTIKIISGGVKIKKLEPYPKTEIFYSENEDENKIDFSDIKGQENAKRGLEIAAAGRHNIAMYGPPGTGKTMLAQAFCYILPPLSINEALETTAIHSIAGALRGKLVTNPPFRAPHHTSSYVSLIGGGAIPKPGEITLAHRGVLFLDEFPEFDSRVINSLRQPLEEKKISVLRAKGSANFPANFILIAAMNPCPCGNFGIEGRECTCSPMQILRYQKKISGPIIDRIDLWVEVSRVNFEKLGEKILKREETEILKKKISRAREIQKERFESAKLSIHANSEIKARDLLEIVKLDNKSKEILNTSAKKLDFSARTYHRLIKIARTIADLEEKETILPNHILEALQYRPKK